MNIGAIAEGFLDGRDAILLADKMDYNSVDTCLIVSVFARRGMGVGASQGTTDNASDGVENFDPIPRCIKRLASTGLYNGLSGLGGKNFDVRAATASRSSPCEPSLCLLNNPGSKLSARSFPSVALISKRPGTGSKTLSRVKR